MSSEQKSVLIAASGSGGHLLPARFIAEALQGVDPDIKISFVGSGRRLEKTVIEEAGYELDTISAVGLSGLSGLVKFILLFPKTFIQAWKLISKRKPDVVIGVGGYVTVVPIFVAYLRKIPSWIHEAELSPGLANRVLAYLATKISVAFGATKMPCKNKVVTTGHPVREDVKALFQKKHSTEKIQKLLVLGGSQGANSVDDAIKSLLSVIKENDLKVWHQSRPENVDDLIKFYKENEINAKVVGFIQNMGEAYSWCDLIISRAGAGSVMELSIVNKPTILIPFPFAQGNHQVANAMTLVGAGKALLVEEGQDFYTKLSEALLELLNLNSYNAMLTKEPLTREINAAETIAKGAIELTQ